MEPRLEKEIWIIPNSHISIPIPPAVLSFCMLNCVIEYIPFPAEHSSCFFSLSSLTPDFCVTSILQPLSNPPQKETSNLQLWNTSSWEITLRYQLKSEEGGWEQMVATNNVGIQKLRGIPL